MEFVLFSKHWKEDVSAMIEKARYIGADGLDFTVRPGYVVNPDNVRTALPAAVRQLNAVGLSVPMITTDGDFVTPDFPSAEATAAAMQEAGVPIAKLGYFRYCAGETPYWSTVDRIRRELERLEILARKYDIAFCYHTHSHNFGSNAAALMDLLVGRDPRYIGAYIDTGHLYYCGEPFPMAVDVVGRYLRLVSLKDTGFKRENPASAELPEWRRAIVPAGYGVVNWPEVFGALLAAGYDSTISCHCEFGAESPEEFTELQKREVAFLRARLAEAQALISAA